MYKAIVIIRVSTVQQEIEVQTKEVLGFARENGYTDDEILVIGQAGASAIKLNKAYLDSMNELYSAMDNNPIECVFAWSLDRVARNEVVMFQLKNYLIEKKIQLKIKNPSLYLLNTDGTVNTAMELALSLFVTMASQEMKLKIERFRRTKKENSQTGKYNGSSLLYGFELDENKYYTIKDDEAEIVRKIYKLYSTGKYSIRSLKTKLAIDGIEMSIRNITRILNNTAYKGYTKEENNRRSNRIYPRIVSNELWDKVKEVREKNNLNIPKGTNIYFAQKLLKCAKCGRNYIATGNVYVCVGATVMGKCDNTVSIKTQTLDIILLYIALFEHKIFATTDKTTRIAAYQKQNVEYDKEMKFYIKQLNKHQDKLDNLSMLFIDGTVSKQKFDELLNKLNLQKKEIEDKIEAISKMINNNNHLIEELSTGNNRVNIFGDLSLEEMNDVVKKYIKLVHIFKDEYQGKKAVRIEVNFQKFNISGEFEDAHRTFYYFPYNKIRDKKIMENDEYIVENIDRMLGDLITKIKANERVQKSRKKAK